LVIYVKKDAIVKNSVRMGNGAEILEQTGRSLL